jgi:Resolvase, N terminal domain
VLTVTRLDRLARSTRDLLNTLATITSKGAGFRSLNDTWADTTTAHGRLMLTVLGGLAEFERELIRARTGSRHESALYAPLARTNGQQCLCWFDSWRLDVRTGFIERCFSKVRHLWQHPESSALE